MSSHGNGLITSLLTRELLSSSKNLVILQNKQFYHDCSFHILLGLPTDIVPATFKKKRATTAAPKVKGEEGDEKPGRPTEETARPTGMGRGSR